MAKKNEKVQKQQEHKQDVQPTVPATPLELTDEELGQVTGGALNAYTPPSTGAGGLPALTFN